MHNLMRNKCVSVWNQLDGWLTNYRQFAEKYDLFELIIFAICFLTGICLNLTV